MQSVFGAIRAFDRLDLLQGINAECRRPAFFNNNSGWALDFKHQVRCLREPTPTSIDVPLSESKKRIAVNAPWVRQV